MQDWNFQHSPLLRALRALIRMWDSLNISISWFNFICTSVCTVVMALMTSSKKYANNLKYLLEESWIKVISLSTITYCVRGHYKQLIGQILSWNAWRLFLASWTRQLSSFSFKWTSTIKLKSFDVKGKKVKLHVALRLYTMNSVPRSWLVRNLRIGRLFPWY